MRDAIRKVNTDLVKSPKRLRALWLALEALNRPLKTETRKFEALKMELVTLMLEAAEWILKSESSISDEPSIVKLIVMNSRPTNLQSDEARKDGSSR